MARNRIISTLSAVLLAALILNGCQRKAESSASRETEPEPETETSSVTAESPKPTLTPSPTPTPAPAVENHTNNADGHHEFQPHVISSIYLEELGEKTQNTLYAYIDAVRNGEDSFPCPDLDTYYWVAGRLASHYCPVGDYFTDVEAPAGPIFQDGTGYIYYSIPKEEVVEKQKAFEEEIVSILDDYVSDDYTDFEKVLALYDYMCTNYTYDNYKLEHLEEMPQSIYGVFQDKLGVCGEISMLYDYLLLQVGVDCDQMSGPTYSGDTFVVYHAWSYVNIDGTFYHVDPTYGLSDKAKMDDFMMTDKCREERDGLPVKDFMRGSHGDECRKYHEFSCTDTSYEELWGTAHGGGARYAGLDRGKQEIVCEDYSGFEFRVSYGK